jgi:hypothetical protein
MEMKKTWFTVGKYKGNKKGLISVRKIHHGPREGLLHGPQGRSRQQGPMEGPAGRGLPPGPKGGAFPGSKGGTPPGPKSEAH